MHLRPIIPLLLITVNRTAAAAVITFPSSLLQSRGNLNRPLMAGRLLSLRSHILRILTFPSIDSAASDLRFLSTSSSRRGIPSRPKSVDIGAHARHLQNRRLWTYGLKFQDQLVFYVTPTDAMEKYSTNPTKNKFRLSCLVLEGSVAEQVGSSEMEFVITDLITDSLVRDWGSLPDLFKEGHSVVVERFVKPITDEIKKETSSNSVSQKARSGECHFSATEVLAKHDEKYMPKEVAAAIERNKKLLEAGESAVATEAK